MYQGRYFGTNSNYPKYVTFGNPSTVLDIHWNSSNGRENNLVLVEDFISAIKINRVLNSMPMWGSSITLGQIKQLSSIFKKIIWWVDPDKQKDYPKMINKSKLFFDEIQCIYSDLDPKYYETKEIKDKLNA